MRTKACYILVADNGKYIKTEQVSKNEIDIFTVVDPMYATKFELLEDAHSTLKELEYGSDMWSFDFVDGIGASGEVAEIEYTITILE